MAIVLIYFGLNSTKMLSVDGLLFVLILAVLANVAYWAAYVADVFAQLSAFRPLGLRYRWILLTIGYSSPESLLGGLQWPCFLPGLTQTIRVGPTEGV